MASLNFRIMIKTKKTEILNKNIIESQIYMLCESIPQKHFHRQSLSRIYMQIFMNMKLVLNTLEIVEALD